jgi:uncharacterized hydrophobic protein (TIGR00271 family)
VPLLRITCPAELTEQVVHVLHTDGLATELAIMSGASRLTGGDLILADVPRSVVDDLVGRLPNLAAIEGLHVAVQPSERLVPEVVPNADDDAVIWAQVVRDVHDVGRFSVINVLLIVTACAIAAIGIAQDQLLLIVGAMAIGPDYYAIADACLSIVRGAWRRAAVSIGGLAVAFAAGAVGAWLLSEGLIAAGYQGSSDATPQSLTLFISRPDALSVVVALLAGVAGALAITLPDARGLVGVFVSVTTIPAAANIGVALAVSHYSAMGGAAVQLLVNVVSLLVAGVATLAVRKRLSVGSAARRRSVRPTR